MNKNVLLAAFLAAALAACERTPEQPKTSSVDLPKQQAQPAPAPQAKSDEFKSSVTPGPLSKLSEDNELSSKVKQALTKQSTGATGIEVSASDGVVTLYGTVDRADQRERVLQAAAQVEGVRSVVNNLVVVRGS